MKFFQTCFLTSLRTRLADWRTWVLLLLFPLLPLTAARLLPAEEVSAPVQVGVVLPREGGEEFLRRLEARSGVVVVFREAGYVQAERRVATGRWDCALVLPEDFEARLAARDLEGLFTLLTGPGSVVYPMVRETVSACVAECVSPGMAEDYLLSSGIMDETGIDQARPRLDRVLLDRDRVLVSMETAAGRPLDPLVLADHGVSALLTGTIVFLLLVWALFTAADLRRWLNSPAVRRLVPLRGRASLMLPWLAAALLPALCAGGLAVLLAVGRQI